MKDEEMTKEQLINELIALCQQISESGAIVKTECLAVREAFQKNFSIINITVVYLQILSQGIGSN